MIYMILGIATGLFAFAPIAFLLGKMEDKSRREKENKK